MKIIAQTTRKYQTKHYLIDISETEIKQILGDCFSDKRIGIGVEIDVSIIYNKYKSIIASKKEIQEIKKQATSMLSSIEKITPIVIPHTEKNNGVKNWRITMNTKEILNKKFFIDIKQSLIDEKKSRKRLVNVNNFIKLKKAYKTIDTFAQFFKELEKSLKEEMETKL